MAKCWDEHKAVIIRCLGFAVVFGIWVERNGKSLRKLLKSGILVRIVELEEFFYPKNYSEVLPQR